MKVIYDYQIFGMQEYGGISRYYFELVKYFLTHHICDPKIIAPIYFNKYINKFNNGIVFGKYLPYINRTFKIRKHINFFVSKMMLTRINPDILHETYYDVNKLAPPRTKTVLTVYDMIHEKFSEHFTVKEKKTAYDKLKAVKRAGHVICISENTRKDLIEITNIASSKTSVVYLGFSLSEQTSQTDRRIMQRPYILFVGHRSPGYKNFLRLLQAYAISNRLVQDFDLVCFGGYNFSSDELDAINNLGLAPQKVIHMSGSDKVLANLYSKAAAFIYPSLYEGFGIPPLEAMSYHCPVICSGTSSIPEVAGNAAEYFDPYKVDNIREAIENVVYSTERSKELISRGLARINQFSWERCAQQTYAIYSSIL
jgi:glycosyltransferase involved in cell wall biosynthesis